MIRSQAHIPMMPYVRVAVMPSVQFRIWTPWSSIRLTEVMMALLRVCWQEIKMETVRD